MASKRKAAGKRGTAPEENVFEEKTDDNNSKRAEKMLLSNSPPKKRQNKTGDGGSNPLTLGEKRIVDKEDEEDPGKRERALAFDHFIRGQNESQLFYDEKSSSVESTQKVRLSGDFYNNANSNSKSVENEAFDGALSLLKAFLGVSGFARALIEERPELAKLVLDSTLEEGQKDDRGYSNLSFDRTIERVQQLLPPGADDADVYAVLDFVTSGEGRQQHQTTKGKAKNKTGKKAAAAELGLDAGELMLVSLPIFERLLAERSLRAGTLRQEALDAGFPDYLLQLLALFTHQRARFPALRSARGAQPKVSVEFTGGEADGKQKRASTRRKSTTKAAATAEVKATGVGYGAGSTHAPGGGGTATQRKKAEAAFQQRLDFEETTVNNILKILLAYISPGSLPDANANAGAFFASADVDERVREAVAHRDFVRLLYRSCLRNTLHSFIRTDSLIEILDSAETFDTALRLISALAQIEFDGGTFASFIFGEQLDARIEKQLEEENGEEIEVEIEVPEAFRNAEENFLSPNSVSLFDLVFSDDEGQPEREKVLELLRKLATNIREYVLRVYVRGDGGRDEGEKLVNPQALMDDADEDYQGEGTSADGQRKKRRKDRRAKGSVTTVVTTMATAATSDNTASSSKTAEAATEAEEEERRLNELFDACSLTVALLESTPAPTAPDFALLKKSLGDVEKKKQGEGAKTAAAGEGTGGKGGWWNYFFGGGGEGATNNTPKQEQTTTVNTDNKKKGPGKKKDQQKEEEKVGETSGTSGGTNTEQQQMLKDEAEYVRWLRDLQFDSVTFTDVDFHYRDEASKPASSAASNARVKRLAKEVFSLRSSLILSASSTAFVRTFEENMDAMKVLITGPAGTPYAGGCFLFDFYFPRDFPERPPQVHFLTTGAGKVRFNPNLYNCGKVCLSILGTWPGRPEESWNAQRSTVLQVITSIQSFIFVDAPYFNEPGYAASEGTAEGTKASKNYNSWIRLYTLRHAILEQLRDPPPLWAEIIRRHFWLKRGALEAQLDEWEREENWKEFRACAAEVRAALHEMRQPPAMIPDAVGTH